MRVTGLFELSTANQCIANAANLFSWVWLAILKMIKLRTLGIWRYIFSVSKQQTEVFSLVIKTNKSTTQKRYPHLAPNIRFFLSNWQSWPIISTVWTNIKWKVSDFWSWSEFYHLILSSPNTRNTLIKRNWVGCWAAFTLNRKFLLQGFNFSMSSFCQSKQKLEAVINISTIADSWHPLFR